MIGQNAIITMSNYFFYLPDLKSTIDPNTNKLSTIIQKQYRGMLKDFITTFQQQRRDMLASFDSYLVKKIDIQQLENNVMKYLGIVKGLFDCEQSYDSSKYVEGKTPLDQLKNAVIFM